MTDIVNLDREKYLMKEVDVIQNIIRRMGSNSFYIKGWSISLVILSLLLKTEKAQNFIALIPWFTFWILDAYFLKQERLFRKLYEWVIENRRNTDDFLLDMNTQRFKKDVKSIPRVMISKTLLLFHLTIFIIVIIYSIVAFIL